MTIAEQWPKDLGGGRGLSLYGEFTDTYGAEVRVQTSSSAEAAHVWVFVQGGGIKPNDGAAHLNVSQATELRDALDRWLKAVEAGA